MDTTTTPPRGGRQAGAALPSRYSSLGFTSCMYSLSTSAQNWCKTARQTSAAPGSADGCLDAVELATQAAQLCQQCIVRRI
jgi:hypothetical protein